MIRGKHGYKYQKLCHNPSPLPRGREGGLTAKSPNLSAKNVIRLNRIHLFLNLQTKFFKLRFVLWQISSELNEICSILPHTPRITQNLHQLLTHYTLCLRYLPRQRTLRNSSELRKFHAIRPHSPRITQNSHHLLTHYTLCFRCLTSGRELTKIPANRAKFTQFTHISRKLHEFHAFRVNIHPYLVD